MMKVASAGLQMEENFMRHIKHGLSGLSDIWYNMLYCDPYNKVYVFDSADHFNIQY